MMFLKIIQYKYVPVILILTVALCLRLFDLHKIYLWVDEIIIINSPLLSDIDFHSIKTFLKGFINISVDTYKNQTSNGLEAGVFYFAANLFGNNEFVLRLPSVIFGILFVFISYKISEILFRDKTTPILAALFAAISITQINYSQQILPFAMATFASANLLYSLLLWQVHISDEKPRDEKVPILVLYIIISLIFAILSHNSVLPILFSIISIMLIMVFVEGGIKNNSFIRNSQILLIVLSAIILLFGLLLFVYPKIGEGYRSYLSDYYINNNNPLFNHLISILLFTLGRFYDFIIYAINLTYNDKFYLPLSTNPIYIISFLIFLFGGFHSFKVSRLSKYFIGLLILSIAICLLGAYTFKYPFGGVRQLLPMTIFVYPILAYGYKKIIRFNKYFGWSLLSIYLILWFTLLSGFYEKRVSPFYQINISEEIKNTDLHDIYVLDPSGPESMVFDYYLKNETDLQIHKISENDLEKFSSSSSFILGSTWLNLAKLKENSQTDTMNTQYKLFNRILNMSYNVKPLIEIINNRIKNPYYQEKVQSIYTPVNGLFLYLFEKK